MNQRTAIGDTFRNPDLAYALERLGTEGVDDFYDGVLGAAKETYYEQKSPTMRKRALL